MAKKKGFWQNVAEGFVENQKAKRLQQERIMMQEQREYERANTRYCPMCKVKLVQNPHNTSEYYCKSCEWQGFL